MKKKQRSIPPPISFESDFGLNFKVTQGVPRRTQEIPYIAAQMSSDTPLMGEDGSKESPGNVPPRASPSATIEVVDLDPGNKKRGRHKNRRKRRRRSTPNTARSRATLSSLSGLNRSESVDLTSTQVLSEDQRSWSGTDRGGGDIQVAFSPMEDWTADGESRGRVSTTVES